MSEITEDMYWLLVQGYQSHGSMAELQRMAESLVKRSLSSNDHLTLKSIAGTAENLVAESSIAAKQKLPSITEQVVHFASDMTKWAASGFAITDQSEKDRRLSICQGCEKYTGTRCSECGCQCSWASWLETKDCPLGKWKKEQQ